MKSKFINAVRWQVVAQLTFTSGSLLQLSLVILRFYYCGNLLGSLQWNYSFMGLFNALIDILHHHQMSVQSCRGLGLFNNGPSKQSCNSYSAEIISDIVNPSHFWTPSFFTVVKLGIQNSFRHTGVFRALNMYTLHAIGFSQI